MPPLRHIEVDRAGPPGWVGLKLWTSAGELIAQGLCLAEVWERPEARAIAGELLNLIDPPPPDPAKRHLRLVR